MAEDRRAGADELGLHLLVLRCQTGDERAFAELLGRFGDRTMRYLTSLVGEAAEDVQQEVWLSVYRGIRGLSNPRAFRTWLFRTTRHRAVDFLRRLKRERELIVDSAVETLEVELPTDDRGIGELDESELNAALTALAPIHREVLLLRYRDDMSYAELALVAGCSIGTVRSRLHYARRRLQELITGRHENAP